jgi:magnesium transporter
MADEQIDAAELEELMRRGDVEQAALLLSELPSGSAAEVIAPLPAEACSELLRALPDDEAAHILEDLPQDVAAAAVAGMPPAEAAPRVEHMAADDAADLMQHLPADSAQAILDRAEPTAAARVSGLLAYPERSAGGLMQLELIAIPRGMTAAAVVDTLRAGAERYATYPASYLYVVDEEGRLDGVLSLRDLLLCRPDERVARIKITNVTTLNAGDSAEDVVRLFKRTHYLAVPVIDDGGVLLGVVTQEDAMRHAEEEAEEDLLRLTGIAGGDEFRAMPVLTRSRRRLSWLSLNVLLNVLAASVIALYQDTLQAAIALAVFLPIISDMSGCSGNQAVAVSIRELALDRVAPARVLWVVGKELSVGLINGLALGLLLGGVAWLWKGNPALGAIVGAALWVNTLVAVVVGGAVPLLLRRFGRDPAMAAGPILTTLTDVCGFFVVLALASHYIHLL